MPDAQTQLRALQQIWPAFIALRCRWWMRIYQNLNMGAEAVVPVMICSHRLNVIRTIHHGASEEIFAVAIFEK